MLKDGTDAHRGRVDSDLSLPFSGSFQAMRATDSKPEKSDGSPLSAGTWRRPEGGERDCKHAGA
jgi:hypothetical protein